MGRKTKRIIKRYAKGVAALCGRFAAPRSGSRILTYHSVGSRDHEMNVRPQHFRNQMVWLKDHAPVVSFAEAAQGLPGVAVTFDDGYRDNLTNAAPVLAELGIPATVFVVAGYVGGMLGHDSEAAALLSWDEVDALDAMGIAVGAHSMTHRRLAQLPDKVQREEVVQSKRLIEERLGHAVESFAYPFGTAADYSPLTRRLVAEAGFRWAASNRYGVNGPDADRLALRRIWIDATDTLELFQLKTQGGLDLLSLIDSPIGVWSRRVLNRRWRRRDGCG